MRLWPAVPRPRAVRAAVTLMLAGAAAELAALLTTIATLGSVRAAVAARDTAAVHAVLVHQVAVMAGAPVAVGLWLWLAWANGRGEDWARLVSVFCFLLMSLSVIGVLAQNAVALAPANMIAAAVVWILGLSSVALISTRRPAGSPAPGRPAVTLHDHARPAGSDPAGPDRAVARQPARVRHHHRCPANLRRPGHASGRDLVHRPGPAARGWADRRRPGRGRGRPGLAAVITGSSLNPRSPRPGTTRPPDPPCGSATPTATQPPRPSVSTSRRAG